MGKIYLQTYIFFMHTKSNLESKIHWLKFQQGLMISIILKYSKSHQFIITENLLFFFQITISTENVHIGEKTYVMGFILKTGNWTLSLTFGTHRSNKFCVFRCFRLHSHLRQKIPTHKWKTLKIFHTYP